MSAEYTVPALRDTAEKLCSDATALVAAAEIEAHRHVEAARQKADRMRAAAAEIEADADAKEARQQQPIAGMPPESTAPCRSCSQPLVRDEMGWRHLDRAVGADCPGATPPTPAPPTAPVDPSPTDTITDGLDTREVAQP